MTTIPSTTTTYLNLTPNNGANNQTNLADIWKTTGQELDRMLLAAGTPVAGDPTQTVVYVQASNANEASTANLQAGTFKTTNSGTSWTLLAKDTTADILTNKTLNSDCNTMNIAH